MTRARDAKKVAAGRLLTALLRSPKTRPGLIAAVAEHGVTRNFVYGWLSEQIRTGLVTVHKSSKTPLYQMTAAIVVEQPADSQFPAWLEPRVVPNSVDRRVYIDGLLVKKPELGTRQ
jgi:hypothetical protein